MGLTIIPFMEIQSFAAKLIGVAIVVLSLLLYTGGTMELLNCIMMCICSFMVMDSMELGGNFSALLPVIDLCVDKVSAILSVPEIDIDGEDIRPQCFDFKVEYIDLACEEKQASMM